MDEVTTRMDKKDRLVVYTALFGDYDDLIDPPEKFEGCDFVCFTDQKNLKSDIWEIRLIEECDLPPNMMNRRYKILPHLFFPEYKKSLYVDANIYIFKNPLELADQYLTKSDFVAPKHFARDCVYDEAKECIVLMKDKTSNIKKQMQRYKEAGFPHNFGLSENNILLRIHSNESVMDLMEKWWQELQKETKRDQLSFPFAVWVAGLEYSFMDESARNSFGYFGYRVHSEFVDHPFLNKVKDKLNFSFRRLIVNWL